ncbi:MAG TPA: PPOX class F420-dependent oxidoreductase [Chloroflexota bacterium]|nr:PPOX class F420-dependent oxidoreductase [Chloroflexota bacterium]
MTQQAFSSIARSRYVSLTTFRRNGTAVPTPVWIAPARGGGQRLYVLTMVGAGKLKRLRHNPAVELAPCTARGKIRGAGVPGIARILPEDTHPIAEAALARKYWIAKRFLDLYHRLRNGRRTYLEITLRDGAQTRDAQELTA